MMNSYKEHLSVLMISDWDVEACKAGQYCSLIVVHEDSSFNSIGQLKESTAVINDPESHSGMNALFSTIQPFSQDGQFFNCTKCVERINSSFDRKEMGFS